MEQKLIRKQRNSSLDLLRIVSMLLIILLHSIDHSGVLEAADAEGGIVGTYTRFLYMLTQICVNCYVLISGYFLVESKFRFQKLVVLWMEVVFYSVIIKLVFMLSGNIPFSIVSLVSCFVPVFTGRYWFITIYFGLYLVAPFLNIAIHAMNREQHLKLNLLLFILFSVMLSVYPAFSGMNSGGGWGLAWFIVLYLFASWFRLYYEPSGKHKGNLLGWIGIALLVAIIYEVGERFAPLKIMAGNWYRYDSVPTVLATLLVFTAFLNINIKNSVVNKLISVIAPSTLGVYLIHAHADFSPWVWKMVDLPSKLHFGSFLIIQIGVVLAIFVACSIVDIFRTKTIGHFESCKMIKKICDNIEYHIERLGNKI